LQPVDTVNELRVFNDLRALSKSAVFSQSHVLSAEQGGGLHFKEVTAPPKLQCSYKETVQYSPSALAAPAAPRRVRPAEEFTFLVEPSADTIVTASAMTLKPL